MRRALRGERRRQHRARRAALRDRWGGPHRRVVRRSGDGGVPGSGPGAARPPAVGQRPGCAACGAPAGCGRPPRRYPTTPSQAPTPRRSLPVTPRSANCVRSKTPSPPCFPCRCPGYSGQTRPVESNLTELPDNVDPADASVGYPWLLDLKRGCRLPDPVCTVRSAQTCHRRAPRAGNV